MLFGQCFWKEHSLAPQQYHVSSALQCVAPVQFGAAFTAVLKA